MSAQPPIVPTPAPPAGELAQILAARPVIEGPLTLDEAVATALRESPVLRGAIAEVDAAVGRLNAARAETRPVVAANTFVSGGSMPNNVESPALPVARMIMGLPRGGFVDQNLMVMFPLFTSGRLQAMTRQAAALRDASRADREAQRQEVVLMTRVAYREVQARASLIEVARARFADNEERLRVDRARLQQAQIPAYYVQRDEAEVASARQAMTNAERDRELSLSQLKVVMGVYPASRFDLSEQLAYTPAADPPTRDDLLARAGRQRPELRAAGERVAGAQAGETAIRAGYRPQVNLFAMADAARRENGGMAGVTYGLAASFPLYTGGGERARQQTAEAERRQQEAAREQVALQIAREVDDALVSLRAAEQNVQTAQTALDAARAEYEAARARYEAGRSIVTEVLDSLAARVRSESDVVQALFQAGVAQDQLDRAAGNIP